MTCSLRRFAGNNHRPRTPRDVLAAPPGDGTTRRRHCVSGGRLPSTLHARHAVSSKCLLTPPICGFETTAKEPLAEPVDSEQTTSAPLEIADNVPVSTQHELLTDF